MKNKRFNVTFSNILDKYMTQRHKQSIAEESAKIGVKKSFVEENSSSQCQVIKDANTARMKELNSEELFGERWSYSKLTELSLGRQNMSANTDIDKNRRV